MTKATPQVATARTKTTRRAAISAARFLFYFTGFAGFVIAPVNVYLMYYRTAPIVFGISLEDGMSPIGQLLRIDGVIVLGWLFCATSILGLPVGRWLRDSQRRGALLGFLVVGFGFFFGVGFAVPFWLVFSPSKASCWLSDGGTWAGTQIWAEHSGYGADSKMEESRHDEERKDCHYPSPHRRRLCLVLRTGRGLGAVAVMPRATQSISRKLLTGPRE